MSVHDGRRPTGTGTVTLPAGTGSLATTRFARSGHDEQGDAALQVFIDLLRDHPVKRATWWDGWEHGYRHGLDDGRAQEARETAEAWVPVARYVRGVGAPKNADSATLRVRRAQRDRSDVAWRCKGRAQLVAECLADWGEAS